MRRFAFQPWHSAKEFHRYLHRFIQELPRINTLEGVDRTPYNQYDSIILPILTYLKNEGVEFKYSEYLLSHSHSELALNKTPRHKSSQLLLLRPNKHHSRGDPHNRKWNDWRDQCTSTHRHCNNNPRFHD